MDSRSAATNIQVALVNRETQPCVFIPVEASFREWEKTTAVIPALFQWIQANNVIPAGPLFYRYIVLGDHDRPFQLEIGIATTEPHSGDETVHAGEIPGGTYATHVHHGHPDQLFQVLEAMDVLVQERNFELDIDKSTGQQRWVGRYEFFLTNPDDEPDPNNWSTEIAWKLKGES